MRDVRKLFLDAMTEAPIGPLLSSCPRILVAFSGGADSAVLLSLLSDFCREKGLSLLAVHVHHGIRGDEAERDAEAARAFTEDRGIDFCLRRVDVPAYAREEGLGLEEAARILRYRALYEIAGEVPGTLIATAHSADDHLETVLDKLDCGYGRLVPPASGNGAVGTLWHPACAGWDHPSPFALYSPGDPGLLCRNESAFCGGFHEQRYRLYPELYSFGDRAPAFGNCRRPGGACSSDE